MLKKVEVADLRPGMFIHDLNADWLAHPFVRPQFLLEQAEEIEKIRASGIKEVYINTERGLDVPHAPTAEEARESTLQTMRTLAEQSPPPPPKTSLAEEMQRAKAIRAQAHSVVVSVMHDVRLGHAVTLDQLEPVVEEITTSILRNSGALVGLSRIKNKDDYTFLHSVSVCTLMVAFCRGVGLDAALTREAGMGGLLHDTGKMKVPDAILNKPGKYTDAEFEIMKQHPMDGWLILKDIPGVGDIPLDITRHHHERMDGSGYPDKLDGSQISTMSQMAAIVDVYDAITSDRCYHKGMAPTEALRKIFEWSKFHFNPELVQAFMRTTGIYPVGTLVLLESGRLGVVVEQNETQLLKPKVRVFFSNRSNTYIKPEVVDLSRSMGRGGADSIVRHEDPAKWKLDPMRFLSEPN